MDVKDLDYEKLFKWGVWCLRFSGAYPDIPRDKKWMIKFTVMHGIFTVTSFFILYSTVVYELKDATKACANMSILVMFFVVTMKYLLLLWHQDKVMDIINLMNKDYAIAKKLPSEEQLPVLEYAKKAVWVTKAWSWITIFTNLVFLSKPFILMLYIFFREGEFQLVEFYDVVYPDPIANFKFQAFRYTVSFSFLYFFDFYAACIYAGVAPMPPSFMLHACGQLEMAKVRLMRLFDDESLSSAERMIKIKVIAKQLQNVYRNHIQYNSHLKSPVILPQIRIIFSFLWVQLSKFYSFVMKIQDCFMLLYEFTLKATSFILPIVLFKTIQSINNREFALEFPTMFFYAIALSSCPCYYGDLLIEQGESFRNTVYMSGWEGVWDKRARTSLLIILTRTQQTLAIKSMFRNISLDALTDVYQQAYAIFNLILAAWDL